MGGHGGLNILPQKRWNVYNYENREKVRKDEEAAAKEEQLKREQARKRDAEFRIEQLRAARGLAPSESGNQKVEPVETDKNPGHINLFEGIKIFDPIKKLESRDCDERDEFKRKKLKKEEPPRVVTAEDEKYRLGYGVAGRGVKLPWYMERKSGEADDGSADDGSSFKEMKEREKKNGKKTLEELREERLKREKKEKERVRKLLQEQSRKNGGFSRR